MWLIYLFIFDKVMADFEAWLVKKNKLLDTTCQWRSQDFWWDGGGQD